MKKIFARIIFSLYSSHKYNILKKKIKQLKFKGNDVLIENNTTINNPENIEIEEYVYIGPNGTLNGIGGLIIKRGTIIGPNVYIHTANHNFRSEKLVPYDEEYKFKKVIIGENVWIGANVSIAPGTMIGEGSIIGMGAVLSGHIPPCSLVIGNPCEIIGERNKEIYYRLKEQDKIYFKYKKNEYFT